jgi:hypothetical protein
MSTFMPYTTDYTNRQVDIELLQSIAQPVNLQQVSISSVTQAPKAVTGIQKLVQRYASALLAYFGTVHFDPNYGTNLIATILGGGIQNVAQLQAAFASASSLAITALRSDDRRVDVFGSIPDDENISSAQLLDQQVVYETATVNLKVLITTLAGDSVTFVVPATASR